MGGRCPGTGAEIPLQPTVKSVVDPCSPGRSMLEQISTLQPVEDPTPEQMDVP